MSTCTRCLHPDACCDVQECVDPDFNGDRDHDEWVARVDAGELCPECGLTEIRRTNSGPIFNNPMFECLSCGHQFFDSFTAPTVDAWTLPLFPENAA